METRPEEVRRRAGDLYGSIATELDRQVSDAAWPSALSLREDDSLGWFVYEWVRRAKSGSKWKARHEIKPSDLPAAHEDLAALSAEVVNDWREAFGRTCPGELF